MAARDTSPASSSSLIPDLRQACIFGDVQTLKRLLVNQEASVIWQALDSDGYTLLHIAAEYGRLPIVKTLLSHEGSDPDIILKSDRKRNTPLHKATDNVDVLRLMFEKLGIDDEDVENGRLLTLRNDRNQNLLHCAAEKGNVDVVKYLLKKNKVDVSAVDGDGATAFHYAAKSGEISVMELLRSGNVDNVNKTGETALHYASSNGRKEAVEWLLKRGASVSKMDDKRETALHRAIRNGSLEIISIILDNGDIANLFAPNEKGERSFDIVRDMKEGATQVVQCICNKLLKMGEQDPSSYIQIRSANDDGISLLHYAAGYATGEQLQSLFLQISRNMDTHICEEIVHESKDRMGNNLFHWAAMNGNLDVVKTLRQYNVDPLLENSERRRPLCLALIKDQHLFAKELMECLGQDLDLQMWMEDIERWAKQLEIRDRNVEEAESPAIYKALINGKVKTAKFIEQNTNWMWETAQSRQLRGNFVNAKGQGTGKTALHWATELNQKDIVYTLCNTEEFSKVLLANSLDVMGKTPLNYAKDTEIEKELLKRPDVQYQVEVERRAYMQACSSIGVSAAVISAGSLAGLLHPPDHIGITFWFFLGFSFTLSIASVLLVVCAALPLPPARGVRVAKEMRAIKRSLSIAVLMLAGSVVSVFAGFLAAAYVLFPRRWVWALILSFSCCCFLLAVIYNLWTYFTRATMPRISTTEATIVGPIYLEDAYRSRNFNLWTYFTRAILMPRMPRSSTTEVTIVGPTAYGSSIVAEDSPTTIVVQ